MSAQPLVLITGANGSVGPRVVQTMHKAGYRVRTLSLNAQEHGSFPDGVEVFKGDVANYSVVRSAVQDVEAVIHLAALLHVVNPPSTLSEQYERINVGGTAIVAKAAQQAGVKRVVLFSTIAVYGNATGQAMTEETPPHPSTIYAQTKLAAERIVLQAERQDGQPLGTVLRLGSVYGARIKGNYLLLLKSLARGWFVPIGDGCNRRTLIYDKDVAAAALLVLRHPAATGQVFNVSDGQFHTMNEIITMMCEALGRTPPRMSLPIHPIRLVAGILEDTARLMGRKSPIVRAMVDSYTEDVAVDSHRIRTQLGFAPHYDLRSGWRETVQEMRRMGYL